MAQTIDRLLNLVPDRPDEVLQTLQTQPHLASAQDGHGYSLLHAAASYNHIPLLQALIRDFNVDINLRDEDGETALFSTETVDVARVLVEELHIDTSAQNEEGQTAAEKFEAEGEYPLLASYLGQLGVANGGGGGGAAASVVAQTGGAADSAAAAQAGTLRGDEASNGIAPPPPLPEGVKIDLGTMTEDDVGEAPDPEFRRRIEELASRPDFQSEENQRELRNLVQDALMGMTGEGREVRQRRE